jgi:hypothetical protein
MTAGKDRHLRIPMNWIKTNIELPKKEKEVIFYASLTDTIHIGYILLKKYRGEAQPGVEAFWAVGADSNIGYSREQVSHWMYLPNPPKD